MDASPSCAQPRAAREELFVAPDLDAPVRVPLPEAALVRIVPVLAAVVRAAVVRAAALAVGALPAGVPEALLAVLLAVLLEALPVGLLTGPLTALPAGLLAGVLVALPAGLPAGFLAALLTGLAAGVFVPGALPAEVLDADADAPAFGLVAEAGTAVLREAGAFDGADDADLAAGTRPALFVPAEPADLLVLFVGRPEVAAVAAAVLVVEAAALVRARRGAGTVAVGVLAACRSMPATSFFNSLVPL